MHTTLKILILLLILTCNASANLNDCELIQINSTHWYFETNQTDLSLGEYNYQAYANNISSDYRILTVSAASDTSFTVTLSAGQTQINFSAVKSIDTMLEPDGQNLTIPIVVVENTGNIAQSFRFYMDSTVNNILTYTSLANDLSNPVEINTTTTTVIISNLAASDSDDVWMYCNLTRPSPGSSEKTLTINSS